MKNLKKIIRTDAAFDILDSSNCAGSDWGAGGCAILASALNKLSGYPMYAIYNVGFDGVEHFGVMTPSGSILDHDGEHRNADTWLLHFKKFEHPRSGKLIVVPWGDKVLKLGEVKFDEEASERLADLIRKNALIRESVRNVLMESLNEAFDSEYKSWKRKNVTIRGVKEMGQENNAGAMLGAGLYTAALSNKSLAREYGKVYFVVGAIPKKPKVFNTLNEWEIWFYNTLVAQFSKEKGSNFPDKRIFNSSTTIEKEMQKLGYDGIIIKGREMVNFSPGEVLYFSNENELFDYYDYSIRPDKETIEEIVSESAKQVKDLPDTAALFVREINQGYDLTIYDPAEKLVYGTITISWRKEFGADYFVSGVAAIKGFGPMIYEFAMMCVSEESKGLMPTRDGDVRGGAWKVWKNFYDRPEIKKNTLSPDSPYFRFDILFSEDDFDSPEEKIEWLEQADSESKKTLAVFNSVYYHNKNSEYITLINKAEHYESKGFNVQKAIDAAEKFWYDSY